MLRASAAAPRASSARAPIGRAARPLAPPRAPRPSSSTPPSPLIRPPPPAAEPAAGGAAPAPATPDAPPSADWQVKYLYDGDCPMCRTLKNVLTRQDGGKGRVAFVNIADINYDEDANAGILYEDAMDTIHVITRGGEIVTGPEALRLLYSTVGLGWASTLAKLPVVSTIVDALYELISKYRLGVGGVDAVIALKRLSQVDAGEDQCDKKGDGDEGCDAPEW